MQNREHPDLVVRVEPTPATAAEPEGEGETRAPLATAACASSEAHKLAPPVSCSSSDASPAARPEDGQQAGDMGALPGTSTSTSRFGVVCTGLTYTKMAENYGARVHCHLSDYPDTSTSMTVHVHGTLFYGGLRPLRQSSVSVPLARILLA